MGLGGIFRCLAQPLHENPIGPSVGGWLQSNVSLSTSFVFGAFCLLLAPSLLLTFFGKQLLRPREVER